MNEIFYLITEDGRALLTEDGFPIGVEKGFDEASVFAKPFIPKKKEDEDELRKRYAEIERIYRDRDDQRITDEVSDEPPRVVPVPSVPEVPTTVEPVVADRKAKRKAAAVAVDKFVFETEPSRARAVPLFKPTSADEEEVMLAVLALLDD